MQHAKCVRLTSPALRVFWLWRIERCVTWPSSITNHFNHCCVSGYSGYPITAAFQGILVVKDWNGVCPSSITSITAAFPVLLCRSRAYAKCQCMDLLLAQRSMSRTKQSVYIERARTHTHTIFREREHTHTHTHHIFYRKRARRMPLHAVCAAHPFLVPFDLTSVQFGGKKKIMDIKKQINWQKKRIIV